MEVGRSLDQLETKIKKLNGSLKQASSLSRELDKAIKLDPKNTEATANKMKNLQTQIGLATQKVALLKQQQIEANKAFKNGDITAKEFNKIQVAVLKTENEIAKYNIELERATSQDKVDRVNKLSKGFGKVETALNKSQKVAQTFSKITLALVTTITASITAFAVQANSLNEVSKALEVNVEKLQLQRNVYKNITGDASNYDSALQSLKGVMNNIALGQGSAYLNILNRLGVSTTDTEGKTKSLSDVYDEVLVSLSAMEDTTLRNALAYELFGDNAINILEVMETSAETIQDLNDKQLALGITTEEQARSAELLKENWEEVKTKLSGVGAELAESLMPIIQTLSEFLIEFVIPILTTITNWFANMTPSQQKFTLFLLLLVILLPKIIGIVTTIVGVIKAITIASYGCAGGIGAVSTASLPLQPILLAVCAVVLTLCILFAFLTGRSKDLTKSLNSQAGLMSDIESQYADMGSDINVNANQVSQNSNTNRSEIHVDIDAHGDTVVSQNSAELVADALADRINRELGGKI